MTPATSKLISSLRSHDALTYNQAVTHSTSSHPLVDAFFMAGASRSISEEEIKYLFEASWQEDPILTRKLIFWAGDVRGGAGERRFFRLGLKWLETYHPFELIQNIHSGNIEYFNRWDSLFELVSKPNVKEAVLTHVASGLKANDGLLAKWLPRKNQYNNFKKLLTSYLAINDKTYRQLIVSLSDTVEQDIAAGKWSEVQYSKVPSQAMNKYRQAFLRHDESRFKDYLRLVEIGDEKINAGAIFPHQLYQAYNQNKDEDSIDAQWNALPNYMSETKERILPVCDVSGSMMGLPMDVSVSLGIYISERNHGVFHNAFMTFSVSPKLEYLKGTLTERIRQLSSSEWGMNTDLNLVFEMILNKAVAHTVDKTEMPTMILIISDMEFDRVNTGGTNFESIQQKYAENEYALPKVVFWNVNGRLGNVPVKAHDTNVALVSGFSPSILQSVLQADTDSFSPQGIMLETLQNQRYERVL